MLRYFDIYLKNLNAPDGLTLQPIDYFCLIYLYIALFFAFESAVIFNDIEDINIDKISNPNRPLTLGFSSFRTF